MALVNPATLTFAPSIFYAETHGGVDWWRISGTGGRQLAGLCHLQVRCLAGLVTICACLGVTGTFQSPAIAKEPSSIGGVYKGTFDHGEQVIELTLEVPAECAGKRNWQGPCVVSFNPKIPGYPSRVKCEGRLTPMGPYRAPADDKDFGLELDIEERWGDPENVLFFTAWLDPFSNRPKELDASFHLVARGGWILQNGHCDMKKHADQSRAFFFTDELHRESELRGERGPDVVEDFDLWECKGRLADEDSGKTFNTAPISFWPDGTSAAGTVNWVRFY